MEEKTSTNKLQLGLIGSAVGLLVGLLFGLIVLGWWLLPVKPQPNPKNLTESEKQAYLYMTIQSFGQNGDVAKAKERYKAVGADAPQLLAKIQRDPAGLPPELLDRFTREIASVSPEALPTVAIAVGLATSAPGQTPTATPKAGASAAQLSPWTIALIVGSCGLLILVAAALALFFFLRRKKIGGQQAAWAPVEPEADLTVATEPALTQPASTKKAQPAPEAFPPVVTEPAATHPSIPDWVLPQAEAEAVTVPHIEEVFPAEETPAAPGEVEGKADDSPGWLGATAAAAAATLLSGDASHPAPETAEAAALPGEGVGEMLPSPEEAPLPIEAPEGTLRPFETIPLPRQVTEEEALPAEERTLPVEETPPVEEILPADPVKTFSTDLMYVEGIGESYAYRLKGASIHTPKDLLEKGANPKGRADIAEQTGISHKLILKWINHIDLFRIRGIGAEYAELLEVSGVDTVVELARRNPENLYQALSQTNLERKLVRKLPTQTQVEQWIEQARRMPRVITY